MGRDVFWYNCWPDNKNEGILPRIITVKGIKTVAKFINASSERTIRFGFGGCDRVASIMRFFILLLMAIAEGERQ